jgi:hypothetical protein
MSFVVDHVGAIVHVTTSGEEWQASAQLFAADQAGRRLIATHGGIGAGGQRRGIAAIWKRYAGPPLPHDPEARRQALDAYRVQRHDIEDAVNQGLGRDPEQHHPPRLAWDGLIQVLHEHGTDLGEEELIAMPFQFEFSPASQAALDS